MMTGTTAPSFKRLCLWLQTDKANKAKRVHAHYTAMEAVMMEFLYVQLHKQLLMLEDLATHVQQCEQELANRRTRTYSEVDKPDCVYINKENSGATT